MRIIFYKIKFFPLFHDDFLLLSRDGREFLAFLREKKAFFPKKALCRAPARKTGERQLFSPTVHTRHDACRHRWKKQNTAFSLNRGDSSGLQSEFHRKGTSFSGQTAHDHSVLQSEKLRREWENAATSPNSPCPPRSG